MDKDKVQDWIDDNIGPLEGFAEFEDELEKNFPILAERLKDIVWEYAEVEAFDDIDTAYDIVREMEQPSRFVRPLIDEFELADQNNEEKKLEENKDPTA